MKLPLAQVTNMGSERGVLNISFNQDQGNVCNALLTVPKVSLYSVVSWREGIGCLQKKLLAKYYHGLLF